MVMEPFMEDENEVGNPPPISNDKRCRYCCGLLLCAEASICPICGKHQKDGLLGRLLHWAPLAPVASAVLSFFLLAVSFMQMIGTSRTLGIANELKLKAEATSDRLGKVEGVLTQVDIASNGRKLCLLYEPAMMDEPTIGVMPLYVPSKWTARACIDQARLAPAGTKFRLGCVFVDHASIGKASEVSAKLNAAIPAENCGW
jgi:hypothetical protein